MEAFLSQGNTREQGVPHVPVCTVTAVSLYYVGLLKISLTYATVYGIIAIGGGKVASVKKLVDKMKRQPNGVSPDEAGQVLENYGYKFDRQNGSHKTYVNKDGDVQTIPKRRPVIKPVYVKQILHKIGE